MVPSAHGPKALVVVIDGDRTRPEAIAGAADITHNPHVVGKMAAHIVLPWVHRIFSNSRYGPRASTTGCVASTSNPTS